MELLGTSRRSFPTSKTTLLPVTRLEIGPLELLDVLSSSHLTFLVKNVWRKPSYRIPHNISVLSKKLLLLALERFNLSKRKFSALSYAVLTPLNFFLLFVE